MVTSLFAGILGLMYIGLSFFVIKGRFKHQVEIGDSDNKDLMRRIRVHGNFIEYTTIFLVLMFLAEQENTSENFLYILGTAFVISRIMHAVGFYRVTGPSIGRSAGMILSFVVIVITSIICIRSFFIF